MNAETFVLVMVLLALAFRAGISFGKRQQREEWYSQFRQAKEYKIGDNVE